MRGPKRQCKYLVVGKHEPPANKIGESINKNGQTTPAEGSRGGGRQRERKKKRGGDRGEREAMTRRASERERRERKRGGVEGEETVRRARARTITMRRGRHHARVESHAMWQRRSQPTMTHRDHRGREEKGVRI